MAKSQRGQELEQWRALPLAFLYRLHFEGAATEAVEGLNREEGYENYYIGRDRRRWATGVGVYGEVLYRSLYEGIDMKVYAAEGAMKYDFIVAAGADPGRIAMRYEGVDGLKLREGNLIVATSVADIVELRPYAYQIKEGDLVEVAARYTLKDNHVGIEVGDYDKSMPLIIDPYLHFSSYTGSTADNWGTTGCFDSEKNTYTSGVVFGTGYPVTLGAYDGTFNGKEAKQGTYFVLVKAKGADGRVYNIRRDVNLLRGYRENESSSTSTNP